MALNAASKVRIGSFGLRVRIKSGRFEPVSLVICYLICRRQRHCK